MKKFLEQLRTWYLIYLVSKAVKQSKRAQANFTRAFELAVKWKPGPGPENTPLLPVAAEAVPLEVENPVAAPPEPLKPSDRARLRRVKKAEDKPVQAPTDIPLPIPPTQQMITPAVNPFSDGPNEVPMCLDPLPEYVVFEAMFNKKYGRGNKCHMVVMGKPNAFAPFELYALMVSIQADKAPGPILVALYGTIYSLIMHQHGRVIENVKALN